LFLILVAWRVIFAYMPKREGPRLVSNLLKGYAEVFHERRSWPFIIWQSASFSAIMVFVTHASFIYQEHFGLSPSRFSLVFGANIVAMFGFNLVNRALLQRIRSLTVLRLATLCHFAGAALLLLSVLFQWGLYAFVPSLMITIGSLGAMSPNTQANYLDYHPSTGGSATAILGAFQFGFAGLASTISTQLPHTVLSIAATIFVLGCISFTTMGITSLRESVRANCPA